MSESTRQEEQDCLMLFCNPLGVAMLSWMWQCPAIIRFACPIRDTFGAARRGGAVLVGADADVSAVLLAGSGPGVRPERRDLPMALKDRVLDQF